MKTLLILGSKPNPVLPPREAYQAVACANASGRSAAQLGLPAPTFTIMSAVLNDGSAAGRMRLKAISGLRTEDLFFYPRPVKSGGVQRRILTLLKNWRFSAPVFRYALWRAGYRYGRFNYQPASYYRQLILDMCGNPDGLQALIDQKQASSGALALAMGVADDKFDRFILSGFSFELSQSYAEDPNIALRGTAVSKHRDTDIAIIKSLADRHLVQTTEPVVHENTRVPIFEE